MTKRAGKSVALEGRREAALSWLRLAVALALLAVAAVLLTALAGYDPADPWRPDEAGAARNWLGPLGAVVAGVLYGGVGLLAWPAALALPLGGWLFWKGRGQVAMLPLCCGGLWALAGAGALLGQSGLTIAIQGQSLAVGGLAGQAAASGLTALAGAGGAWAAGGMALAGGAALIGHATWPLLGQALAWRPTSEPEAAPRTTPRPEPIIAPDKRPEPTPEPTPTPAVEPANAPALEPTPRPEPPAPPRPRPQKPAAPAAGPRVVAPAPLEPPKPSTEAAPCRSENAAQRFALPSVELLRLPGEQHAQIDHDQLMEKSRLVESKLADYHVAGHVAEVAPGPVVTVFEFKPAPGVKISKVAGLADDLAMNLRAQSIRIVAPIPGKAAIGIEIPSAKRQKVFLRELLDSDHYRQAQSPLTVALGKDILGRPVIEDLCRMPHLLIAGATGAGKSVFINSLVLSILYKSTPDQVRLIMVDPKRIELSTYNDVPHLLHPIITSPKEATAGLRWAVAEMERRYTLLAAHGVRNIGSFNDKLRAEGLAAEPDGRLGGLAPDPERPARLTPLPHVLIIIDELADLMMVSSKDVEGLITRLAQMARASGIHLVLATQRPSVDVITGLIKANFPARISFQVSSRIDSRTILDQQGAEHLLGAGDMLFLHPSTPGLKRVHGAFVSDGEIEDVVEHWKNQGRPNYDESVVAAAEGDEDAAADGDDDVVDELYQDAVRLVRQSGQASISFVQRRLRVGYNRAARMIEQMEQDGVVGPSDGSRPREVLLRD
ncbi:DNA translocase FtsK [Desulfarculus baarsii]